MSQWSSASAQEGKFFFAVEPFLAAPHLCTSRNPYFSSRPRCPGWTPAPDTTTRSSLCRRSPRLRSRNTQAGFLFALFRSQSFLSPRLCLAIFFVFLSTPIIAGGGFRALLRTGTTFSQPANLTLALYVSFRIVSSDALAETGRHVHSECRGEK